MHLPLGYTRREGFWPGKNIPWPRYDTEAGGGVGQGVVWDLQGPFIEIDDWRGPGIKWMIDHSLDVFGS